MKITREREREKRERERERERKGRDILDSALLFLHKTIPYLNT